MRQYGLDTETPMGKLGCIATNEEVIEATEFNEVVTFLTKRKHRASIFWTFNLQFDVEHILKSSNDRAFLQDLYDNGIRRPGIKYEGCNIQYIPRKLFKLCKNGSCATVYDIAQFYNHVSLEKASKQYLPESERKTTEISAQRIGEEEGYYGKNRELVLEYCKQDALATVKLAHVVEDIFTKEGISFRSPISQAKISEMYVRDHYKYPKIPPGLEEAHEWAKLSYHGGLFWTLQRGFFNQDLFSYDINSAYPSVMSKLPHWGNGSFKWVNEPNEHGEADYGWYGVEFDSMWIPQEEFKEGYCIDICYRDIEKKIRVNPKRIIYPTGKRKQVITKAEYDFLKRHNMPCKFLIGLEWYKENDKYPSPFEWMPKIFNRRNEIRKTDKTGMLQYALKIVLNGLYGKTAQSKKGTGILTNFFYASYITALTRLQVAEVAIKNLSAVVEIATDSVTLTRPLPTVPSPSGGGEGVGAPEGGVILGEGLGEWGLDEYAEGLFIGSGMRQEWYHGGDSVTYARGLTDKRDFDLRTFLEKNRDSAEAWFTRKRPIHLGEMLVHYKALKYEDLGVFTSVRKKLSCNTDKKQVWDRDYEDFGDFLDSAPMRGKPLKVELVEDI